MPLEATVICMDNSEHLRNGDYTPTRMEAQQDAASVVTQVKINDNPENTVAVMTTAGKGVQVVVTLSKDMSLLLSAIANAPLGGVTDIPTTLKVAQLVLKHRQNKLQKSRIILFVGSPVDIPHDKLKKMGGELKKNNVALDVVNFGEHEANTAALDILVSAANKNDNSHLVTVPVGPHLLSDMVVSSPICSSSSAAAGMARSSGGGMDDFDASADPELAMALRLSLEEERQRQARLAAQQGGDAAMTDATPAGTQPSQSQPATGGGAAEDDDLARAMRMSTEGAGGYDDDQALQLALQMSMAEEQERQAAAAAKQSGATKEVTMTDAKPAGDEVNRTLEDAEFLNEILATLPGVDASDPRVQEILKQMKGDSGDQKGDKK